jgi:hypothetical protein
MKAERSFETLEANNAASQGNQPIFIGAISLCFRTN